MRLSDIAAVLTIIVAIIAISTFLAGLWSLPGQEPTSPEPVPPEPEPPEPVPPEPESPEPEPPEPEPPDKPVIKYFKASPSEIKPDESATLSWSVSDASNVNIVPGIGNVGLTDTKVVSPTKTTTYTLTATNDAGSVEANAQVEVIVPNEHSISNIQLDPPSPKTLPLTSQVEVTFDYATTETGGVRIFVRPYTDGSLTPNYAASGSPLYPTGQGKGEGDFTIQSKEVTVDQLRFQMLSADQSRVLYESFISVNYRFYTLM